MLSCCRRPMVAGVLRCSHEPIPQRKPRHANTAELNVEGFNALPFAADGGRFIVYALDGISPYQALQALIERYPAHEN